VRAGTPAGGITGASDGEMSGISLVQVLLDEVWVIGVEAGTLWVGIHTVGRHQGSIKETAPDGHRPEPTFTRF
jgi:hypothetical protein